MSLTSAFRRPAALVALMLACGLAAPGVLAAERAPVPSKPLPSELNGRVIVKFKDDAGWRKQILAASQGDSHTRSAQAVQHAIQLRADALGTRRGVALRAMSAIDERTHVVTAAGVGSRQLAALLSLDGEVESVEPDGRSRALRVPNDPLYAPGPVPSAGPASGQWYLKPPAAANLVTGNEVVASINAEAAWDITRGHASVVVAVLDTGIRRDHPDLASKLLPGYDLVSDAAVANDGDGVDADPSDPGDWVSEADRSSPTFSDCERSDSSWHGTQVAGLVGAATDNATGMAGAGWNTRILPVRVLGKCFGYDSDILKGMRWAAGLQVPGLPTNPHPAQVVNLSLGGEGACGTNYRTVVAELASRNVVVVAAAGNTSGRAVNNPANCPGVIGVAALRHIGTKVGFSDLGPEIAIAAPGGNCVNVGSGDACLFPLLTTTNAGTTTPGASSYSTSFDVSVGTSFSAPLVSGTVALMLTAHRGLTPTQVREAIQQTARPFPSTGAPADPELGAIQVCRAPGAFDQFQCYCTTSTCGAGMLDARGAVARVARLEAYVDAPTQVTVGQAVTFSSASTVARPGTTITGLQWSLATPGAGIQSLTGLDATAPALSLTPTAAGTFTVQLRAVDSEGGQSVTTQTVTVVEPGSPPATPSDGGGGGGALSVGWLALLGLATLLSGRPRRRA